MSSKDAHCQAALENHKVVQYLSQRIDEFPQWVMTVAFYKALHIVEAILAADPESSRQHTDDHGQRNQLLKTTKRYHFIWEHYRPLYNDSLIARYLREDSDAPICDVFSKYLPPKKIQETHLNHHLVQIIKSGRRLLNDPNFMSDCVPR